MRATATSSHHAEAMAALLGLRMAGLYKTSDKLMTLHTDDKEIVTKMRSNRQPRNSILMPIFTEIRNTVEQLSADGTKIDFVYRSRFTDQNMSHVDWLSKSVVNPQE